MKFLRQLFGISNLGEHLTESEIRDRKIFIAEMKVVMPKVAQNLWLCESALDDPDRFVEIKDRLGTQSLYNYLLTIVGYFNSNISNFLDVERHNTPLLNQGCNIAWKVVENDEPDNNDDVKILFTEDGFYTKRVGGSENDG